MPVEILGLDDVPLAGDELRVAPDDKIARTVAEARSWRRRKANLAHPMALAGGARLEDIFAMVQRGEVATLNLVLKADVQGSLEAVTDALRKLDQKHEEVRLSFVHRARRRDHRVRREPRRGVERHRDRIQRATRPQGARARRDREGGAPPLRGHLPGARGRAERARRHAAARVRGSGHRRGRGARGLLRAPGRQDRRLLRASTGTITRGSRVRFLRDGVVIWNGTITSLKRFKDDVREVQSGFECGIGLSDFQDLKPGDIIETYELKEIPRG